MERGETERGWITRSSYCGSIPSPEVGVKRLLSSSFLMLGKLMSPGSELHLKAESCTSVMLNQAVKSIPDGVNTEPSVESRPTLFPSRGETISGED